MFQIESRNKNKNGFTLIEILIAMAIFMIILGIAIVVTKSFSDTVNLDNAGKIIGTNIKLAKTRSISALNNTNYGVHFESDQVIVFAGSVFDAGDSTNKIVNLPDNVEIYNISIAGGPDLVFGRLTGTTDNFGAIGIRLIKNPSETKQIVINSEGQVDYALFQTSSASPITNARHVHYKLGWNIENSSILRFEWIDDYGDFTTKDIDTASYFNTDKSEFDWYGEMIDGSSQILRVRGWLDADSKTVLCVIRDQTETATLNIYFIEGGTEKKIATYDNDDGAVSVTPDFTYGGVMTIK